MKVGIYYPTWNAPWVSKVQDLDLTNIGTKYPGLNWVFISFAKPDLVYKKGQNTFQGTGLDFSMDFQIVKVIFDEGEARTKKFYEGLRQTRERAPRENAVALTLRKLLRF
jgi:hypothetical protein